MRHMRPEDIRLGGMTPSEQASTPTQAFLAQIQRDASRAMGLVDTVDYRNLEEALREARHLLHQIHMVAGFLQGDDRLIFDVTLVQASERDSI